MATRKTTPKTAAGAKTKAAEEKVVKAEESVVKTEEPVVKAEPKAKAEPKKYKDDDRIPCCSITVGEYLFVGDKSHDLYDWVAEGDVVNMRYDDLVMAIRTRKPCVYKPRIIIQDDEFLAEYSDIQSMYDTLYSKDDLMAVLALDANRMADVINRMPEGAKDAIKGMAMKAIEQGTLDSLSRVKVLDQIFGTDMLLKLTQ